MRTDFTAEMLLETLAQAIQRYGTPRRITLDRDPRSVGTPHGGDLPSALLRFGASLGIEMHVCAPRHPQENDLVAYCTPFVRCGCFLIFASILHRSMLIG